MIKTGDPVVTSAVTLPATNGSQTRSAPVAAVDHGASATAHREAVVTGVSEAHCAFCGLSIEPTPGRRYCSARCRARASERRRIGEALYRERLRDVYARLDDADRRRFDAERAAGDTVGVMIASIFGLSVVPTREDGRK